MFRGHKLKKFWPFSFLSFFLFFPETAKDLKHLTHRHRVKGFTDTNSELFECCGEALRGPEEIGLLEMAAALMNE